MKKNITRKMCNQEDQVLAYLDMHGSISTREATTLLKIKSLHSVISNLRTQGYKFEIIEKQYGNPGATRWALKEEATDHVKEEATDHKIKAADEIELDFSGIFPALENKSTDFDSSGGMCIFNTGKSMSVYESHGDTGGDKDIPQDIEDWLRYSADQNGTFPEDEAINALRFAYKWAQQWKQAAQPWKQTQNQVAQDQAPNQTPAVDDIDDKVERIKEDAKKAGMALGARVCHSTAKQIMIASPEGWGIMWWTTTGTVAPVKFGANGKIVCRWPSSVFLTEEEAAQKKIFHIVAEVENIVPFIQSQIAKIHELCQASSKKRA